MDAIMIKEVPGDEHEIHSGITGTINDGLQAMAIQGTMRLALLGIAVAIAVEMNVSRMQDFQRAFAVWCHQCSLFLTARCTKCLFEIVGIVPGR
jgi:hypothetical protein